MDLKQLVEEFDLNSVNDIDVTNLMDRDIVGNLRDWARRANVNMIFLPDCTNLDNLELLYSNFMSQPQKFRRIADWESIYAYKATNRQIYDIAKSRLLKQDINTSNVDDLPLIESAVLGDNDHSFEAIQYGPHEVEEAIYYSKTANRAIIYPTSSLEDLERLWDQFNLQIKKNRRESDWECLRLFNCTNLTFYTYLKSKFLKEDIKEPEVEVLSGSDASLQEFGLVRDTASFVRSYTKMLIREESITDALHVLDEYQAMDLPAYDASLVASVVDDVRMDYETIYKDVDTTPDACNDLPFFDPDELIDMGVTSHSLSEKYFGAMPLDDDNFPIDEFMSYYTLHFNGIREPLFAENASKWVRKVRYLCNELAKLKINGSDEKINEMKQTILEYGWNPELEFNDMNRLVAQARVSHIMEQRNASKTNFVDLRGERVLEESNKVLQEMKETNPLYPIYIVLVDGDSWYAGAIKWWTRSKYSHASISFDSDLRTVYSFGADAKTGMKGGFIIEDIKNLPKNLHMAIYAIFAKKEDYDTIKQNVEYYQFLSNKTRYGYTNILTLLFNIPMNKSRENICSQFVDSTLKLADIDLTGKDSSLVTPEDFHQVVTRKDIRNKKIYILFQGLHSSFRPARVKQLVDELLHKARPVREGEGHVYEPCIQAYREIKELPVRFNDGGDLIIDKPGLDLMGEYSKCHKLLMKASEAKNYEVMKYELAKLWRMNEIIERRIYRRQGNTKQLNDARAHILNDFNKYIAEVLQNDPKFNFSEYYEATPYGSGALKINRPTLKYGTDMIIKFLKAL